MAHKRKDTLVAAPVKLPSAEQLAQIAAGLGIQAHPATALKKAVSLYLHARAFVAKHDNSTEKDLASACGDVELAKQLWESDYRALFNRTLLLEPDKPRDEVRSRLAKDDLKFSKAKSVLENLRALHRLADMRSFLHAKKIPTTWENGEPLSPLGEPVKSDLKAKCRMVTRREYDQRTEAIARQHGWPETDWEAKWQHDLAKIREQRAEGHAVYRVPEIWLGQLVPWKKSLKHTGGHKSRKTAQKNSSKTS